MSTLDPAPVILVHGGAWAVPDFLKDASIHGVKDAARKGYDILKISNGSSLDAVECAVRALEDNPVFNAGTGSSLNEDGEVEMDACIMEGKHLNIGAVASIRNIRNPIEVARMVMEKTEHVLLVGGGANRFAAYNGITAVEPATLITDIAVNERHSYRKYKNSVVNLFETKELNNHDTVGAVAIDCNGHVACATSTGGVATKMLGRVGDSPVVGCGVYCDDNIGAICCTGHGESILKICLARHISGLLEQGVSCQQAVQIALDFMKKRVDGYGGAIAIDKNRNIGFHFTTERMPWAYVNCNRLHFGIDEGIAFQEDM